jgi:sialic acid synthase SpsE
MVSIIAEIGNAHEGSLGLAKCFINAAAECGVDAVKFQTHIFEAESLPDAPNPPYFENESRKEYFDRREFTVEQWKELKGFAEGKCGIEFLSSPFSLEAVDLLEQVGVSIYKIASGEVSNLPLLIKIAKTGKRVLLSSGMSSWTELDEAVKTLQNNGCENLTILQCTSEYPCISENAGLNIMVEMKERYGLPVGFSDHTLGIAVPIAAVCLGACIIEKHFTLSKLMYGPDAKFSATPEEMKALVENIRSVEKALRNKIDKNDKVGTLSQMKITFEKSIVAACDIPAGAILEERHFAYKKPGDGIPAREFRKLLGKKTMNDIPANTKLEWSMFDNAKKKVKE